MCNTEDFRFTCVWRERATASPFYEVVWRAPEGSAKAVILDAESVLGTIAQNVFYDSLLGLIYSCLKAMTSDTTITDKRGAISN